MVKSAHIGWFASLALWGLGAVAHAQTYTPETLRGALEAKAKAIYGSARMPGMNVAVLMPDDRWIRVSVGYRNLETRDPLRLNDRMLAGSVGKLFFATAIMQLVQDGRLDLDARISTYVSAEPWFRRLPNADSLKLRHLMQHTSGIPEHVLDPGFVAAIKADPGKIWGHAELLGPVLDKPALFAAGQGWSYADTNYIVAALVMEKVTGRDAYGQITQRILRPMKLDATEPSDDRRLENLAVGYNMPRSPFGFEGPNVREGQLVFNPQMEWAGGGFVSAPLDLSRFVKLLFEGRIVALGTVRQMTTGVAARTGANHRYGLGVQVRPSRWGETWGHSGWFPGYLTDVQYFPTHKLSIAVQVNTDEQAALGRPLGRLVEELAEVVFGPDGLNVQP